MRNEKVQKSIWTSRSGHTVILDDSDSGVCISICDEAGTNMVFFDAMNHSLKIEAIGNISIKAQNVDIEAEGTMTIKGMAGINVEGSPGQVNVKGTTINLN